MKKILFLIILILLLPTIIYSFTIPKLSFQEFDKETLLKMLDKKELILVDDIPGTTEQYITAGILINTSPENVWQIITDYTNYPKFYPQTYETVIVKEGEKYKDIKITLKFKFSIISTKVRYILRYFPVEDKRKIAWYLVDGDMKINQGMWTLIPVDNGNKTIAFYSVYTDLKTMGGILKYVLKKEPKMELAIATSTAILVARSTRDRANELYKNGKTK